MPLTHGNAQQSRGIGLADMVCAHSVTGRIAPRANWRCTCSI
jgi:hypothetical protein